MGGRIEERDCVHRGHRQYRFGNTGRLQAAGKGLSDLGGHFKHVPSLGATQATFLEDTIPRGKEKRIKLYSLVEA
jgi:hypothetical protein